MKKDTAPTDPFREYEVEFSYHTDEKGRTKVIARNAADAKEIATIQFKLGYTEKCILDRAEVIDDR
jgi:hypothetical protein